MYHVPHQDTTQLTKEHCAVRKRSSHTIPASTSKHRSPPSKRLSPPSSSFLHLSSSPSPSHTASHKTSHATTKTLVNSPQVPPPSSAPLRRSTSCQPTDGRRAVRAQAARSTPTQARRSTGRGTIRHSIRIKWDRRGCLILRFSVRPSIFNYLE